MFAKEDMLCSALYGMIKHINSNGIFRGTLHITNRSFCNASRVFTFFSVIICLKEFPTFVLTEETTFTAIKASLQHMDVEIQLIHHGFPSAANHMFF